MVATCPGSCNLIKGRDDTTYMVQAPAANTRGEEHWVRQHVSPPGTTIEEQPTSVICIPTRSSRGVSRGGEQHHIQGLVRGPLTTLVHGLQQ
jgi:hypothetical protein